MPGAWEQGSQTVLVGVLHVDVTTVAWALGLKNLQIPGQIMPVTGMPYDHARNAVCQAAIQNGFDFVFFLDSDVIPPNDAIIRLMRHRLPVVSGVYFRRSPPHSVPVMMKHGRWYTDYPKDRLFDVDFVGAGCMLIHTSVLQQLPPMDERRGKRWFDWRVDMSHSLPPGEALSEDFALNLHMRRHGINIIIDPTVKCRHVGFAQAGPELGQFTPMEVQTHT